MYFCSCTPPNVKKEAGWTNIQQQIMLYAIGRLLQLAGLLILPLAISGEVAQTLGFSGFTLKESLMLSGVGVVVFYLGWLVQKSGK